MVMIIQIFSRIYEKLIGDIDERLQSLEKRSSVEVRSYDDLWK